MKVLAVIGSPRKGNGLKATQRVEAVLRNFNDVEVEYIFLGELNIYPCKGCCECFVKGENECPNTDDIKYIVQKIDKSDGVIFVSPTYSMNMTALMKAFLERISYISHRARFFEKAALIINTSSGMGIKDTLKSMEGPISSYGFFVAGKLGIATKTYDICEIPDKYNKMIETATKQFYNVIKNKSYMKPKLISLINFKCLQAIYLSAISKGIESCDIEYWKSNGWLDKNMNYYIKTEGISLKVQIAKFIAGFIN